jgi:hypothetical protein
MDDVPFRLEDTEGMCHGKLQTLRMWAGVPNLAFAREDHVTASNVESTKGLLIELLRHPSDIGPVYVVFTDKF